MVNTDILTTTNGSKLPRAIKNMHEPYTHDSNKMLNCANPKL